MFRALALWSAGLWACAFAGAQVVNYNFILDGLQEVPPVATPGFGNAHVTLDTATNMLSWNITYSGLIGALTAAHFHAPADYGVNAPVIVPLAATASPIVGSTMITDTDEAHILAGMSYVNLHTTFKPGGEIRGQVVPEPGALALLALGAVALRRRR